MSNSASCFVSPLLESADIGRGGCSIILLSAIFLFMVSLAVAGFMMRLTAHATAPSATNAIAMAPKFPTGFPGAFSSVKRMLQINVAGLSAAGPARLAFFQKCGEPFTEIGSRTDGHAFRYGQLDTTVDFRFAGTYEQALGGQNAARTIGNQCCGQLACGVH